jgi:hypothetical protein
MPSATSRSLNSSRSCRNTADKQLHGPSQQLAMSGCESSITAADVDCIKGVC